MKQQLRYMKSPLAACYIGIEVPQFAYATSCSPLRDYAKREFFVVVLVNTQKSKLKRMSPPNKHK